MKIFSKPLLFVLTAMLLSTMPISNASASRDKLNEGNTPLISAVNTVNTESVKLLISKGADVNAKDKKGYNALLYAVESNCQHGSNNADIIKLLINNGANIHAKNPEDETVLDIALACRRANVLNDLLKAGVNLWTPETGKARVFFLDYGLKVDMNVMVGNKSKYLNKDGGVVYMDVEPGKHNVSAQSPSAFYHSAANLASPVNVTAGEAYYYRIAEQEGGRLDYFSSLVRDKRNYPVRIVAIKEAAAKKEINELLKLKEESEEKEPHASTSAEIAKPNQPQPAHSAVQDKRPEVSAETVKPISPKPTDSAVKENSPEFFGYAQKLRELKKLKEEGLLTDKEYEQKRKAIVDKM